MYNCNCYWKWS